MTNSFLLKVVLSSHTSGWRHQLVVFLYFHGAWSRIMFVKHIEKPTAELRWGSSCGVLTRLQAAVAKHAVSVVGLRFCQSLDLYWNVMIDLPSMAWLWQAWGKTGTFKKQLGGTEKPFLVGLGGVCGVDADFAVLILTFSSSRSASDNDLCLHYCWTSGNCFWKLLQIAGVNNWELGERYYDV